MSENFLNLESGGKMPIVGLGTWQAGDLKELEDALDVSFKAGYRHIDTAYAYVNESMIGKVLQKWFEEKTATRNDMFVTTKLPIQGNQPELVEMFLTKSLKNLQLDYVDLYLIHGPVAIKYEEGCSWPVDEEGCVKTVPVDHVEVWKQMEEQVKKGRAKNIGVSNFNQKQIERILKNCTIKPACLQIEIHVYLQQNELVEFCHRNGIAVVAYSPLGTPSLSTFMETNGFPAVKTDNLMDDRTVKEIARKHAKSPAQILLKFLIQRKIAVIPKSTNETRIKENINIFDFHLDDDDMELLRKLDRGENGRIVKFDHMKGFAKHAEFPFK